MKEIEYPVVAVIWEDHSAFRAAELPDSDDLSDYVRPSLTLGLLYKKTKKYIIVVSHIDRYENRDEPDWMVIYKSAILGIKEYGTMKISRILTKGD